MPGLKDIINIEISIDCYTTGDHEIIAYYGKPVVDTLVLPLGLNDGGYYEVIGYLDSLGNGVYTYERSLYKDVIITPISDSIHVFKEWDNENGELDSLENYGNKIYISIGNPDKFPTSDLFDLQGRRIELQGEWALYEPTENCQTFTYNFEFYAKKGDLNLAEMLDVYIDGILQSPNSTFSKTYSKPFPSQIEFRFRVKNVCYFDKINAYYSSATSENIFPGFDKWLDIDGFFVETITIPTTSYNCQETINIVFGEQKRYLTVDLTMDGDGLVPTEKGYVDILLYPSIKDPKIKYIRSDDIFKTLIKEQRIYECDCGTVVDVYPVIGNTTYDYGYWQAANANDPDLQSLPVVDPKTINGKEEHDVLAVELNDNKHVQYRFDPGFRLDYFSYYEPKTIKDNELEEDAKIKTVYYNNLKMGNIENIYGKTVAMNQVGLGSYLFFNGITPNTAEIGFSFSKPVNESTIDQAGTFYAKDNQVEVDYQGKKVRLDTRESTSYYFRKNSNGRVLSQKEFYLTLTDTRYSNRIIDIPHMSDFLVTLHIDQIRSVDGDQIIIQPGYSPILNLSMNTEYPSMQVSTQSMDFFTGDYSDRLYGHVWAAIGYQNKLDNPKNLSIINSQGGAQYPNYDEYENVYFGNRPGWNTIFDDSLFVLYVNRIQYNDLFMAGFELIHKGASNSTYSKYSEFADSVVKLVINTLAPDWKLGKILSAVTNALQPSIWEFWATNDHIYTSFNFPEPKTRNSLWGNYYIYYPQVTLYGTDRTRLFLKTYLIGQ